MRCQQCGAALTGSTCVPCRSKVLSGEDRPEWSWPGQSPASAQGRQPSKPTRADLPWWVTLLASVPPAAITLALYLKVFHGNVVTASGAVFGAAVANLVVSWLISRIFKARPRLTWMITYYVLTIAAAVNLISSAVSHPTVTKTYTTTVAWPQGWKRFPVSTIPAAKSMTSLGGSSDVASLKVNGSTVALIVAVTIPLIDNNPIESQLTSLDKGQRQEAQRQGFSMNISPPVEATWRGRRALQEDSQYNAGEGRALQRLFATIGDDNVLCMVSYKTVASEFDKHLADFEAVKESFVCPSGSTTVTTAAP